MARKVVATAYGRPADVIEVIDVADSAPADGYAVVAVRASALNPFDVKTVAGVMGTDPGRLPLPVGREAAGVITALGGSVTDSQGTALRIGDEVVVYPFNGAVASQVAAESSALHLKPSELPFDVAAGLLLVGVTAADTVATAAVTDADTLLVHGGAGAVGVLAVQLALGRGATVIATASDANHDHLRALGARPVAYGTGLIDRVREAARGPVTAAIDTVGTDEAVDVSTELISDRNRIVSIAAFDRSDDVVLLDGSSDTSKHNRRAAIPGLLADAAAGRLVVDVAKVFALEDTATALTELSTAHPRGKFIVRP